jgi:hypothetical protein
MADSHRNPLIIPEQAAQARQVCSACQGTEFNRRRVNGVVLSTCRSCGEQIQGGLPGMMQDPLKPLPPINPLSRPTVDFTKNSKGEYQELRRRPDPTPAHRKGAPIPGPDEE